MKFHYPLLFCALMSGDIFANTSKSIKDIIDLNFKYSQSEDIEGSMSTMHSQSPGYAQTKQMLHQLFPAYDLKFTLVSYQFVGEDGEYAYAKVKQLTEKVAGPEFKNNELDALQVFKQENGQWKLWTQANLSVTFVE